MNLVIDICFLTHRKTAKTFMAAATFLELLKTFGDVDVEVTFHSGGNSNFTKRTRLLMFVSLVHVD